MRRIAWPVLMQLGLVQLRLAPEVFWALTPAELMARTIDGGPLAAAEAAARLLKLTFTVPDGEA